MTVSSSLNLVTGLGNGVATVFSYSPLVIFASDQLEVTKVIIATGVETPLSEGLGAGDYSVSPATFDPQGETGSVTFPADQVTPMPSTEKIVMRRVLPVEQTVKLQNQGTYFPKVLETALDKTIMLIAQLVERMDRSVRTPVGFSGTVGETDSPVALLYLRRNAANDGYNHVAISTTTATASDLAPQDVSPDASAAGTGADFSRDDHVHKLPARALSAQRLSLFSHGGV